MVCHRNFGIGSDGGILWAAAGRGRRLRPADLQPRRLGGGKVRQRPADHSRGTSATPASAPRPAFDIETPAAASRVRILPDGCDPRSRWAGSASTAGRCGDGRFARGHQRADHGRPAGHLHLRRDHRQPPLRPAAPGGLRRPRPSLRARAWRRTRISRAGPTSSFCRCSPAPAGSRSRARQPASCRQQQLPAPSPAPWRSSSAYWWTAGSRCMPGGKLGIEIGDDFSIQMTGPVIRVADGMLDAELFQVQA